ncbi:MAG: family 78 glycoside hydrolase catalytic domain [Draconibacterium sp.]
MNNKERKLQYCLLIVSILLFSACAKEQAHFKVEELRCCKLVNPEGIESPLLGWKIKTQEQGLVQSAWEIQIASSAELLQKGKADVWNSGKQLSDQQFDIIPEGIAFEETGKYFWRVRIWDGNGSISSWSEPASFSIGLLSEASWTGKWISYPYSKERPLPYFRKTFQTGAAQDAAVERATLYFCGLGAGELYLNGQLVDSTRFLDPAQTNYEQYALYSTFDVTSLLEKGDNCLGVMLGNGWFTQDAAWNGAPFSYGPPMMRAQLVVFYNDGSKDIIASDESWTWHEEPVQKTNIYLGESYDARNEIKGWSTAGFQAEDWQPAQLVEKSAPPVLKAQLIHPIRKKEVIQAVDMWQDASGNWFFDFGVNAAGVVLLKAEQPAGTNLNIKMAEEPRKDGGLDYSTLGWIHHGKIFEYEYVCKGEGMESWSPRFAYHGFRYAELSGFTGKPDLSTLSLVVVHSDVENTGSFECSEPQINRLHELAMRTVFGNLHGIPTDCPDREKCGWLGDSHAYVKMANVNLQMNNFWEKYLEDIRSGANPKEEKTLFHERFNTTFYFTEKPSGLPYMIAPGKRLCGVASPDWGTALVQLPWWLYVYYGTKAVLEDYYPDMKTWTDHVASLASNPERTSKYNKQTKHIVYQGLGDWCPPGGNEMMDTPIEFTSTAFHYLDVCIVEQTARLLGFTADAEKYASLKEAIAGEMVETMYNASEKTFGSQTADVMALDFGLVPADEEEAVAQAVVRNMTEKHDGFMNCGIFGIGRVGSMLARYGQAEAAFKMFTKTGENSFARMWDKAGATSLWETLPVSEASEESGREASHNHPMQAGYDICFYEDMAGIRPDASAYKVIRFEPLFMDWMDWAKASIESPYGSIVSDWKHLASEVEWNLQIPANSSGIVALPNGKKLSVNGAPLDENIFTVAEKKDSKTFYHFPSGSFQIRLSE